MNLPNKITMVRIILIPLMILFYLADYIFPGFLYGKLIAFVIFIVAACTDFIDGYIARSRGLVTNLGKFLDPIADKLLVTAAMLLVVVDAGVVPMPYGVIATIIIISRELIISAFRQIAATKNIVMAADWWGKIKAVVQDVAIAGFILLAQFYMTGWAAGTVYLTILEIICYVTLGIAVLLTIYSGINYIVKNRAVLKD